MDNTKKMLRISNINTKETTMKLYDIDWNAIEEIFDDLEETPVFRVSHHNFLEVAF